MSSVAKPKPVPGVCIYCGEPGSSQEHFFGKWLNKIRPAAVRTNFKAQVVSGKGKVYVTPHFKQRNGGNFSSYVRRVCEDCNGKWLSAIQDAAKPTLLKLIDDEPVEISADAIVDVVRWITNATILGELLDPISSGIPASDAAHFYKHRLPPPGWEIFIGRHSASEWQDRYLHTGTNVGYRDDAPPEPTFRQPNTQVTVFTIGALFVLSKSAQKPDWALNMSAEYKRRYLTQLWPLPPADVSWPMTFLADNEALDALQRAQLAGLQ